jgi:hypothetical protein
MACYYYNFINKYSQRKIAASCIYVAIRIIEDKMGVSNRSNEIVKILIIIKKKKLNYFDREKEKI